MTGSPTHLTVRAPYLGPYRKNHPSLPSPKPSHYTMLLFFECFVFARMDFKTDIMAFQNIKGC